MKNFSLLLLIIILFTSINSSAQDVSQIYSSAMDAYHSADYTMANKIFEKLFTEKSISDELYATAKYYSADALLNLGENNAAANNFELLVNNFRWSAFRDKALYKLGLIYFNDEVYSRCRYFLTLLLDEYPGSEFDGNAQYWIGESFSKENKYDEAISFFKQAIANQKNNKFVDYSIYTLGTVYEKIGDYKNAVKTYDELLSFHRESKLVPAAQIRIGISYFKLKDYQSSILELNNPLVVSLPRDQYAESLYLLANSYYRVSDYANAEKTYSAIINDFPSAEIINDVKYSLAWSFFQQKKYNQAFSIFNSLSEGQDSIAIKSYYWKAEAKRYSGQEAEAFNIYKEFLLKYPGNDLAYNVQYQLGVFYFNDKKYDSAQQFLQDVLDSGDGSLRAKSHTLLGEIQLEQRKYPEAVSNFKQVAELNTITPELKKRAILGLGSASFYSGNYENAINYLTDLLTIDSEFEKEKANFLLAESYFKKGEYSEALRKYNNISTANTALSSLVLYGKAYCYFDLGDYENSSVSFSEFVKKYPNDSRIIDAKLRLADSYYGAKNFTAASKVYRDLSKFNKSSIPDVETYYQYAQTLYKSGNTSDAINEFKKLKNKFPGSEYADKSLYVVGWINFQQNNFTKAINDYQTVLDEYPNSSLAPMIYYSIGDAFFNQANYDSAIIYYQKVLDKFPNSATVFDAINGIQYSYVAMNQTDKAVSLIENFVDANPGLKFSGQIYFKKGEIYYGLRDYNNAILSYKDFIVKFPGSDLLPDAFYWIAKSSQNIGQAQEAIFNYTKILNSFPGSESAAGAVIELSNIYNKQKKYDEALSILNKATVTYQQSERLPEILFLKAVTLSNQGNLTDSYESFNLLIQNYRNTVFGKKAMFEVGLIELAAKRYDNAIEYFQELSANNSDDLGAQAQYYLGETLFEQNKITDAISSFVRVRTVFSTYDEWLTKSFIRLGDCYAKLKDKRQAEEMYRTVISKHRTDEYGKEAASKLRKLK